MTGARVAFTTLGCKVNQSETDLLARQFVAAGYVCVPFDEPADVLAGLRPLRYKRHEVVVMHVLDGAELDFPFQEATLCRGLDEPEEMLTDPRARRDGYLEQVGAFVTELQRGCRNQNIDYVQLRTDRDVGVALSGYLAHRLARTK